MSSPTIYFRGIWPGNEGGHFTFAPTGGMLLLRDGKQNPWSDSIGAGYLVAAGQVMTEMNSAWRDYWKKQEEPEGVRFHAQRDGWTLVSWYDRSADDRSHSIAAFVIEALLSAEEAEQYARSRFPVIFWRIDKHLGRSQS